jgi:hypothetical protein
MPGLNSFIDMSHHNQNLDFSKIKKRGAILGIIHKAPQKVSHSSMISPFNICTLDISSSKHHSRQDWIKSWEYGPPLGYFVLPL